MISPKKTAQMSTGNVHIKQLVPNFIRKYYECFDFEQNRIMSFHSMNSKFSLNGQENEDIL